MSKYHLKTLPLFSKLPTHRFIEDSEELIESALFSGGDNSDIARPLEDRVSSFIRCNPFYFLQCTLLFYYLLIFTFQCLQRKQNGGIFSSLSLKFRNQASFAYMVINLLELLRSMTLPTDLPRERWTIYLNIQLQQLFSFATVRNLHFHLLSEGIWRNSLSSGFFILEASMVNILSIIPQLLIACEVVMSLLIPERTKGFFSRSSSKASSSLSRRKRKKTIKKNRRADHENFRKEDVKDAIRSFQQRYIKGVSIALCSLVALIQLLFIVLQLPKQIQSSGSHTSSSPSLRDYLITIPRILLLSQFLLVYGRTVLPSSSSSSANLQNRNKTDDSNNEKKKTDKVLQDDLSKRKKEKRKKKQELPKEDLDERRSTSILDPQEQESVEEISPVFGVKPDKDDREDENVN